MKSPVSPETVTTIIDSFDGPSLRTVSVSSMTLQELIDANTPAARRELARRVKALPK